MSCGFTRQIKISQKNPHRQRKVIKIIATLAKNRNEMKVEREIAWFSLPFAAGVIAAAYAADVPAVTESIFASSA